MSCDLTVEEARAALDERVRESMKWHFSPETGCPYWLDRARELDFDPVADVTCFNPCGDCPATMKCISR